MNADPEVMEYFPAPLDRRESDGLIEQIEAGFERDGFGLWALEVLASGEFIGFAGLASPRLEAHFTPAVEVGWRLARGAWGQGYATEAGRAAIAFGFGERGLEEIVSFTSATNARSRAVMERLGMTHDPGDDFDHPRPARRQPAAPPRALPPTPGAIGKPGDYRSGRAGIEGIPNERAAAEEAAPAAARGAVPGRRAGPFGLRRGAPAGRAGGAGPGGRFRPSRGGGRAGGGGRRSRPGYGWIGLLGWDADRRQEPGRAPGGAGDRRCSGAGH